MDILHRRLNRINNKLKLSIAAFLLILICFPIIFSNTGKNFNRQVNAQTPTGQKTLPIYGTAFVGDTLDPNFTAKTWYGGGTTVNLTNTNPVYSGVHSISYEATAPSDTLELFSDTPIDITPYNYLTFYAQAGMAGLRFQITLLGAKDTNGNHKTIGTAIPFDSAGGIPTTTYWTVYGFPVQQLLTGAAGQPVYGIGIMDLNGGGAQQPVYIDEIMFSTARATQTTPTPQLGPPGTPTLGPTPIPPYFPEINPWVFIIPGIIIFIAIFFE